MDPGKSTIQNAITEAPASDLSRPQGHVLLDPLSNDLQQASETYGLSPLFTSDLSPLDEALSPNRYQEELLVYDNNSDKSVANGIMKSARPLAQKPGPVSARQ